MSRKQSRRWALALMLWSCAACASSASDVAPASADWPIVCQGTFASAERAMRCATTDAAKWRWSDAGGVASLELLGQCDYQPAVRSPFSIALLPELHVADFDLELDLLQTGREYGHRDLCLVFGFQDPQHFYYVHLATTPDQNAHNVFVVDGAPRKNLLPPSTHGVDWGQDQWHHVRIERRIEAGTIRVFWDEQPEPILQATSTRFGRGRIGVGSFDDSGRFANLVVRAPRAESLSDLPDPFRR